MGVCVVGGMDCVNRGEVVLEGRKQDPCSETLLVIVEPLIRKMRFKFCVLFTLLYVISTHSTLT